MVRKPNFGADKRRKEHERRERKDAKRADRQQRRDERRSEDTPTAEPPPLTDEQHSLVPPTA